MCEVAVAWNSGGDRVAIARAAGTSPVDEAQSIHYRTPASRSTQFVTRLGRFIAAIRMSSPKLNRPAEILLVEDKAGDVELVRLALESCKLSHNLHVAEDGIQALRVLRTRSRARVQPDLVLLDLHLPRKDGYEVLSELKGNGDLKVIPVLVLTTSDADEDILRCYRLHANGVVTKPSRFQDLVDTMRSIDRFWFDTVQLPVA